MPAAVSFSSQRLYLGENRITADLARVPVLDGLRALSIGIVLVGHFFLGEFGGLAALGVYLFFIVSGFLVTRLLLAENKREAATGGRWRIVAGQFWWRRLLRLYPVLIAYVAAMLAMAHWRGLAVPWQDWASALGFFANYHVSWLEFTGRLPVLPLDPLWSLAVEMHFYLLLPLLLLLRGRALVAGAAALIALPLLARIGYVLAEPSLATGNVLYRLTETRLDSLGFGVLLAALCELPAHKRIISWLARHRVFIAALTLLALSYLIRDPVFKATLRYTLRSAACMGIVAYLVFSPAAARWQRLLEKRFSRWLGQISYSLYIWHSGAWYFLAPVGLGTGLAGASAAMVFSFALAVPSFYLIEQPAQRVRRRSQIQETKARR